MLPKKLLKQVDAIKYAPMSREERIGRLERIYDESLLWLEETVLDRKSSGTGAATLVLERSRMEKSELERAGQGMEKQEIIIMFKPAEKEQENAS